MKRSILYGALVGLGLSLPAGAVAQAPGAPQTYKGLQLSAAGVEMAASAALSDCPPGANTQRAMARTGEQMAIVSVKVTVTPSYEAGPLRRPVLTDEAGNTYNTAASFVDVGREPEYTCAFPFRVPTGTRPKSIQIESVTLDLTSLRPGALQAARLSSEDPWYSTFSIIVYDPTTNQHGVAVQSRAFGAGAAVPYAKAGVGAVATQAAANRQYGPKAIALLEQGLSPEEVVKRITDEDALRDRRQVAVMDAKGRAAVYTGKTIITRNTDAGDRAHWGAWAGHALAPNISAQGNTLASEEVVKAMVRAYQNSEGEMVERLMAALEGGQSEGGDIRGMQSAGILIVRPFTDYPNETNERVWDIRVDDAVNPFQELRRVMNVRLSSRHTQRSAELAQAGKLAEAIAEQKKAVAMHPNNDGVRYTLAQRYAQAGEYMNALESLEDAIAMQARLKEDAARDPAFATMSDMVEFK